MKIPGVTSGSIYLSLWFAVIQGAGQAFTERAAEWGVEHYHRGTYGGGVAVFDYNNDGFEDIYLTGGHFRDKLYKNNGNQTFTDITLFAGFAETSKFNTMSVTAGDINHDGYKDLFIGTFRGQSNLMYINNGDHTFTEIGAEAGINRTEWAIGGAFGDFNLDGSLDIYVINYVADESLTYDEMGEVNGFDHECFPNQLFLNNGDLTFSELISPSINNAGCGLAVAVTDLNNDHVPDIYVANDFGAWVTPNAGLKNDFPENSFSDISISAGLNAAIYGMGIAIGDYDRDGLLDYYVSNLGANVLYRNDGDGQFSNRAESAGVLNTLAGEKFATSWGTAFFDYDLDGFEDLFVSNGYVPAAAFISAARDDPNQLYKNLGEESFEDVAADSGLDDVKISRGMAVGDLDNDGDLDIVVTVIGESDDAGNVLIYENRNDNDNNWLKVKLKGQSANYDGFGAKVYAYGNGIVWVHEIEGGSSHASQNSSLAHIGLGETKMLDSLVILWPGGNKQKLLVIPINELLMIEENTPGYAVAGCMDTSAGNYHPEATFDYGCFKEVAGCLDQLSPNFNINANEDADCDGNPLAIASGNEIRIFPNPTKEKVSISIPTHWDRPLFFQILSISGSVIDRFESNKNVHEVNLNHYVPGIYIITVRSEHIRFSKKVIVH